MAVEWPVQAGMKNGAGPHRKPTHCKRIDGGLLDSTIHRPTMDPALPSPADALLIVDVQNDFLPGGALGVPRGNEVVPLLNRYAALFDAQSLPVYASRDWHPKDHCSFKPQGGILPPHCMAGTQGAQFAPGLRLPARSIVVSKAQTAAVDAYSVFEGTDLARELRERGVRRLFVGGLATDYCVLNTVADGLRYGFDVVLLVDAVRAVDIHPGDGATAIEEMKRLGAVAADDGTIRSMLAGAPPSPHIRGKPVQGRRCAHRQI